MHGRWVRHGWKRRICDMGQGRVWRLACGGQKRRICERKKKKGGVNLVWWNVCVRVVGPHTGMQGTVQKLKRQKSEAGGGTYPCTS